MKPLPLLMTIFKPATLVHLAVLFALLETLAYLVAFGPLASLNVLLLAAALGVLALETIAGRVRIAPRPEYAALCMLFVVVTLSVRNAINPTAAFAVYRRIISDFALFVLAALTLRSLRAMRSFLVVLLAAALLLGVDLLVQSIGAEGFRVAKEGWDANEYGVMCVALAPSSLAYMRTTRSGIGRLLAAAAMILVVAVVVLTASRTAMLAGGFAVAMLVLWRQIRPRTLVVGALAALLLLPLLPQKNLNRLMVLPGMENTVDREDDPYAEKSYTLRVEVWKHALTEVVPRHMLLGVGLGNWNHYSLGGVSAHNMYLSVLGEHGLIGLAGFLTILAASIVHYRRGIGFAVRQNAWQSCLMARCLFLGLLLLLLGGLTLTIEFRLKLMWLLLGAPLGLKHVIESEVVS